MHLKIVKGYLLKFGFLPQNNDSLRKMLKNNKRM